MLFFPVNARSLRLMSKHLPVLLREVLEFLAPRSGSRILDCTFGGGGHTRAILSSSSDVSVVALDCDPQAGVRARAFQEEFGNRFQFYDLNFADVGQLNQEDFEGILIDLGVSSFQLDDPQRGFSYRHRSAADMRLNPREGMSAATFLENASREDLIRAVRNYGEEKQWRRVVDAIISARGSGVLQNTGSFADLVESVASSRPRGGKRIHPATRVFQGIRIAINRELENLESVLPKVFEKLADGGILAVISFHSLEDRIVKRFFRRMAGQPEHARDSLPQQMRNKQAEILTGRPVRPSSEEVTDNPRSRSARLRVLRKLTVV